MCYSCVEEVVHHIPTPRKTRVAIKLLYFPSDLQPILGYGPL